MKEKSAAQGEALPEVCVLLSMYNGARYLREQVESIARQQGVRVHLEARDDGSRDGSAELCEALCREFGLSCRVERAANVGAARSFIELMYRGVGRFDYFAFSDQDDVWKPDKLERAVRALAPLGDEPAVYCSGAQVTDSHLNPAPVPAPAVPRLGFGNALIQNVVQGATATVNRAGVRLLQSVERPQVSLMHDWWLYLVISAFGTVIYDPYFSILYRQHDSNVLGAAPSPLVFWRNRIRRHFGGTTDRLTVQAAEFGKLYGEALPEPSRRLLADFLQSKQSTARRLRMAFDRRLWRSRGVDDAVFRVLMVLGRY